jgi:hypothetical protein
MTRARLRWAVCVAVVVAVSGCGKSPAPPTAVEVKRDRIFDRLESFRLAHQKPVDSYEYVRDAKKELRALVATLDANSLDDRLALDDAAWEVLGRGDVLTPADYWILWLLRPESPPRSREIVEKLCAKMAAFHAQKPAYDLEVEMCGMTIEALEPHIPAMEACGVIGRDKRGEPELRWEKWPELLKAVATYKPAPSPLRPASETLAQTRALPLPAPTPVPPAPTPDARGKRRQEIVAALEKFRLAHQEFPQSYDPGRREWATADEQQIEALDKSLGISGADDVAHIGAGAWEMLGRGDVFTYADVLFISCLDLRGAPPSRKDLEGICSKFEAWDRSTIPPEERDRMSLKLLFHLGLAKFDGVTGLRDGDGWHWERLPDFRKAAANYNP